MNIVDRILRRKWRIIIRSRLTGKPVVSKSLAKADSLLCTTPPTELLVTLAKPGRQFHAVAPSDQLELYRVGILLVSLPIRSITYTASTHELSFRAEPVPW